MTKQLKRVTFRSVPAPARMRPAGMKPKSCSAARKRGSQTAGSASVAASARATRSQVASMPASGGASSGPA